MKPKSRQSCRPPDTPPAKAKAKRKHSVEESGGGGASPKRKRTGSASHSATPALGATPDCAPFDHERLCPRYVALVGRDPHQDPATVDEVDPLLHEVEAMLVHTMTRQRALARQMLELTGSLPAGVDSIEPPEDEAGPRAHILKVAAERPRDATPAATPSRHSVGSKPKSRAAFKGADGAGGPCIVPGPDPEVVNFAVPSVDALGRHRIMFCPQNNMPDKFWHFVADHARPIAGHDLHELDALLSSHAGDRLDQCYMVPGLAKHYTLRRSAGDAQAAQQQQQQQHRAKRRSAAADSGTASTSSRPAKESTASNGDARRQQQQQPARTRNGGRAVKLEPASVKDEPSVNGEGGGGGPSSSSSITVGAMTERLVHALLEAPPASTSGGGSLSNGHADLNGLSGPASALVRDLDLAQWPALERKIKKELEQQGFLDAESSEPGDQADDAPDDDEVLCELRQRQAELRGAAARAAAIGATMRRRAQTLHDLSQHRDALRHADAHILELYRRYYNLVPARRPANKKERDQLRQALQKRKEIVDRLRRCAAATE